MGSPLLLAHETVRVGPWIPTANLDGVIKASGLKAGEDEVVVRVRDPDEKESDYVLTIQCDSVVNIGPLKRALIQANHTIASGSEVFVWVS